MANIYTRGLKLTDAPWRVQDPHRGIVYDQQDRRLATVPKAGEVPLEERLANLAAIAAAPELLGALREAASVLESLHIKLTPEFYELMSRAAPYDEPVLPPQDRQSAYIASQVPPAPSLKHRNLQHARANSSPDTDDNP